jgi:hypothetical protein
MAEQLSEQLGDDWRIHEYNVPNQEDVDHYLAMTFRGGPSFFKLQSLLHFKSRNNQLLSH